MKGNLKNNKGITLVALVITIIILLILATVTIRIVLSEGIIKRAQNATENYNTAQTNELAQLDNVEGKMEKFEPKAPWWQISDTEKSELADFEEGAKIVAIVGSDSTPGVQVMYQENMGISIFLFDGTNFKPGYYYSLVDGMEAQDLRNGEENVATVQIKKEQWYKISIGNGAQFVNADDGEYHGSSPISLSTFEGGTIYSESYLKRIIDSF